AVGERKVALRGSEIVQIETEGVRIPRRSEVAWRLRAACEGVSAIEILVDGEAPVRKQVVVGEALRKISRRKNGPGAWEQFLYPAEPSIDGDHSVCQVDLRYPARELYLGDLEIDWLAAFVILTMVFGLVLKRPLGVQL
ncbi:MAG: hypothetical protein ACM3U2_13390, partial [Deltaproteobacteria bacterium]